MKLFHYILLAISILCFSDIDAQDQLRVGINGGDPHLNAQVFITEGSYVVTYNDKQVLDLPAASQIELTAQGSLVTLKYQGKVIGNYQRLIIQSQEWESKFRLSATQVSKKKSNYIYPDNLIVRALKGRLFLVNEASVERYVAGVTEAESGAKQELEYYKVQAIIARTYALANKDRHINEGFNVCDQVHCQAYHGIARYEYRIPIATWDTKDQVLVDSDINLITAAFHSNCGGHTLNSEYVWSKPLPYLVGRPDTFCLVMPHSNWEKRIPKEKWLNYLRSHEDFDFDEASDSLVMAFYPTERTRYFSDSLRNLRMTTIRRDMGLRSAFFVIDEDEEFVNFTGVGFGHGVGLCQEGAMRMARSGFRASEIIHYYYKEVHLIDKKYIDFFREE
ncbi:SpoIID/LytB domain-containing protein [Sanyastnella coralliicola]|uniref:SpoIID/LytB domain-containing protein n=1 Tax=Sanyastnella coralliicola TaxID=3069118 RepID=UPI0027BB13A7|nr:SpoIID/LytB domain-containing protein [Longitalea sp. SCSIO 12813]